MLALLAVQAGASLFDVASESVDGFARKCWTHPLQGKKPGVEHRPCSEDMILIPQQDILASSLLLEIWAVLLGRICRSPRRARSREL